MQIIRSKRPTKAIAIIAIILLVAVASATALFFITKKPQPTAATHADSTNAVDYNPPTDSQTANGSTIKDNSVNKPGATSGSDTPSTPSTVEGSSQKSVSMAITALNQTTGSIQVRTRIDAIDDGGTCTFTLTSQSHDTITRTAAVQASASTSTCKGFDVSGIPAGDWTMTISYDSPSYTGSATRTVTVE